MVFDPLKQVFDKVHALVNYRCLSSVFNIVHLMQQGPPSSVFTYNPSQYNSSMYMDYSVNINGTSLIVGLRTVKLLDWAYLI